MKKRISRYLSIILSMVLAVSCFPWDTAYGEEASLLSEVIISGSGNTTEAVTASAERDASVDEVRFEWEISEDGETYAKVAEGEKLTITNKLASDSVFRGDTLRSLRLKAIPIVGGAEQAAVYSAPKELPRALGPRNIGESRIANSYQANAPEENVFCADGNSRFILLDTTENDEAKFFVFSCGSFGHSIFDPDALTKYDPGKQNNIAEVIERLIWQKDSIPANIKNHAAAVDWKTEGGNVVKGNTPDDYMIPQQRTCLLSFSEFMQHRDKIGCKDDLTRGWWLRTPQGAWYDGTDANATQTGMIIGISPGTYTNAENSIQGNYSNTKTQDAEIRLAFYLDRDFFLDTTGKIPVSDMGENVKKALSDIYTTDELLTVYTPEEVSLITGQVQPEKPVLDGISVRGSGETGTQLTAEPGTGTDVASVQYQWEVSTDGKSFSPLTGQTAQSAAVTNAMASYDGTVLTKTTRYVRLKATPVSDLGFAGDPVYSEPLKMPNALGPRSSGESRQSDSYREYADKADLFTIGESSFIVLDMADDDIFIFSVEDYGGGNRVYDSASMVRYKPEASTNIGHYIKNTIWEGKGERIIPAVIKQNAKVSAWKTEAGNLKLGDATNDYIVKEPVCLLSFTELMQYKDKIGAKDSGNTWWLRTPQGAYAQGGDAGAYQNMMVVFPAPLSNDTVTNSLNCNSYGANAGLHTRLAMHLDKDFFLDAKIPVEKLGENVRRAMAGLYSYEELRKIYSQVELNVYFGMAEYTIESAQLNGTAITASVKSSSPNDEEYLLIAVIYDQDGRQVKHMVSDTAVCKKEQTSTFRLNLPVTPKKTDIVQVMLWSDWSQLTPMAVPYTVGARQ